MKKIQVKKISVKNTNDYSDIRNIKTSKPITLDSKKSSDLVIKSFIGTLSDDQFKELISEVIVRFNTEPKRYEKSDFKKLLQIILRGNLIAEDKIDNLTLQFNTFQDIEPITDDEINSLFIGQ